MRSAEDTTRVKEQRSECQRHEKFKRGHWVWVSSTSGSELSPHEELFWFVFLKFGTWFGHVTADALQTLKVMRSNVKVVTRKRDPPHGKKVILLHSSELRFTVHHST